MAVQTAHVTPETTTSEKPGEQAPPAERPAWLPEKFKTPEDFAQAYSELEKKQSTQTPPPAVPDQTTPNDQTTQPVKKTETPPPNPTAPSLQKFHDEFAQKGNLSAESYKELAEKHGLPQPLVDSYIRGLQLQSDKFQAQVHESVGGSERFDQIQKWANDNLSQSEHAAFNRVLESGDDATVLLAVKGLAAQYDEANGQPPNLVTGDVSVNSGLQPFQSKAELVAAMSDPRYKKDSAYRAQVQQRLAHSTVI